MEILSKNKYIDLFYLNANETLDKHFEKIDFVTKFSSDNFFVYFNFTIECKNWLLGKCYYYSIRSISNFDNVWRKQAIETLLWILKFMQSYLDKEIYWVAITKPVLDLYCVVAFCMESQNQYLHIWTEITTSFHLTNFRHVSGNFIISSN